jgi:phosphatidate cytidylyltransferase
MLKTRIVTALVLFCVFLSALFYLPPEGWLVFVSLIAAIAAWEWGALMGLKNTHRVLTGLGMVFLCALIAVIEPEAIRLKDGFADSAWSLGRWFYLPAAAFWIVVVPLWMRRRWSLPKSILGLLVGAVLILPTWLALAQLRALGPLPLIAVMATVWIADIAAYFFGRSLGRHKLAPTISPGKTWEGAIGGGLAVVVYGFVLSPQLPQVISANYFLLFLFLVIVAAISVVGDLFESLLKRQAGLKDSSSILPGHGGVLDRIDSLTSTLPLVSLIWLTTLF